VMAKLVSCFFCSVKQTVLTGDLLQTKRHWFGCIEEPISRLEGNGCGISCLKYETTCHEGQAAGNHLANNLLKPIRPLHGNSYTCREEIDVSITFPYFSHFNARFSRGTSDHGNGLVMLDNGQRPGQTCDSCQGTLKHEVVRDMTRATALIKHPARRRLT